MSPATFKGRGRIRGRIWDFGTVVRPQPAGCHTLSVFQVFCAMNSSVLDTHGSKSPQGRCSRSHHPWVSGQQPPLHSKTQQHIPRWGQAALQDREDGGTQSTETKGESRERNCSQPPSGRHHGRLAGTATCPWKQQECPSKLLLPTDTNLRHCRRAPGGKGEALGFPGDNKSQLCTSPRWQWLGTGSWHWCSCPGQRAGRSRLLRCKTSLGTGNGTEQLWQ